MKRLLIIYNPRSSRFADVKREVLAPARKLKGYMVGKYEVEKTGVEANVQKLAKLLKDGDTVLAAGGDATAVIAVNAIMHSGRDATLAVLPYGNFNDLARTLGTEKFESIFNCRMRKLYPLEVIADGKHWRYATCYVTIGMTAEAVKLYDSPRVRKKLKTWWGRMCGSYTALAGWYFKNRRKRVFIPEFRLNGMLQDKRTSNYAAVNGRSMARVMKGGEDWTRAREFRSGTDRMTNFWRLCRMMIKSMLVRVPGAETQGDVLELVRPGRVEVQAEGESVVLEKVSKIEIKKTGKWIKVLTR